jgi:hypothetical protein
MGNVLEEIIESWRDASWKSWRAVIGPTGRLIAGVGMADALH